MLSEQIANLLQKTRQEKGFTVEDISRAISIRAEVVKSLEEGDFVKAGAMVYTKSYLRKYAEFLGLDKAEFEELISQLEGDDPLYRDISETYKLKSSFEEQKQLSHVWIYLILFIIIVVGLATFLYYDPLKMLSQKEEQVVEKKESDGSFEDLIHNLENEGILDNTVGKTGLDDLLIIESSAKQDPLLFDREENLIKESQEAERLISQQRDQEDLKAEETGKQTEPLPYDLSAIPKDTLIIAVKGECWVGIKDKNRKEVANKILKDGTYDFNGTPPYSITVGNARAVESIMINGNEIDEKIYRPTPNTTVKNFSIDPKEYEQGE